MSDPPRNYRVFNNRDQPVELYCGGQAVIVGPWESVTLAEDALSAPQIQTLLAQGLLTALEPVEAAPSATAEAPAAAGVAEAGQPTETPEAPQALETPPEQPGQPPKPRARARRG